MVTQVAPTAAILWRRLDQPGHDACRLRAAEDGWRLTGTAVFSLDGRPCHLSYTVDCDAAWHTRAARVDGWLGADDVEIAIEAMPDGRWRIGGNEPAALTDCIDVDLNFTPSTNLLQLRRLALSVGQAAEAPVAWLRFPDVALERLEQRYRRLDARTYEYEAPSVGYAAPLHVNEVGFVTRYPGLWEAEGAG